MGSPSVDIAKLESLVNTLAQGMDTLLAEIQSMQKDESKQLAKYKCLAAQIVQVTSANASGARFVNELQQELAVHEQALTSYNTGPKVAEAMRAREAVGNIVTTQVRPTLQRCPVGRKVSDPEDLEMDFTTPGVQGSLECPFAKMQHKLPVTPNSIDPIAAEFHQDQISIQASDGPPNASKCPIRFLDQHSPEEVAKYFENHKHEIPRSHEICVKRYQQNEHSIRELDAKYGSLVNMIQGLGVKHKQYLPKKEMGEAEAADDEADEHASIQAVEKWAENISQPADEEPEEPELEDEDRPPRFEKPLREIRVGESPSRPWGIPVPVAPEAPRSAPDHRATAPVVIVPADVSSAPMQKSAPACPFGHVGKERDEVKAEEKKAQEQPLNAAARASGTLKPSASASPQIIFNGPVFFGYSPEQATTFLQSMNLGNMNMAMS